IEYVEALACPGGCVGGPLTAENSFVARARLERICRDMPYEAGSIDKDIDRVWDRPPVYRPIMKLDEDIQVAMQMAIDIDELEESLPGLDCGSCGAPSCHAFAEDVVRGYASETDCIFRLRELVEKLREENKKD
ncbi:MAG: ferredoxin, partial [Clostridia bacterium]|nr:ferredoxin [Clostridia bacterium]